MRFLFGLFGGRRGKSGVKVIPVLSAFTASVMVGLDSRLLLHYVVLQIGRAHV